MTKYIAFTAFVVQFLVGRGESGVRPRHPVKVKRKIFIVIVMTDQGRDKVSSKNYFLIPTIFTSNKITGISLGQDNADVIALEK